MTAFENDVEMYGAQTIAILSIFSPWFENDVEMYGAQTCTVIPQYMLWFENDVEMYGAQTFVLIDEVSQQFENDVEMYGAQIYFSNGVFTIGYRDWAPEHEKMGKGVTLTEDEMMKLKELL